MLRLALSLLGLVQTPSLDAPSAVSPAADQVAQEKDVSASAVASGFYEHAERGLEHYAMERYGEALGEFDAALTRSEGTAEERATIEFNAAACAFALGHNSNAERRFEHVAARFRERAPLALINAGYAALFAGRLEAALVHLEASRGGAPELEERRKALASRISEARTAETAALTRMGQTTGPSPGPPSFALLPSGPSALLLAGGGYDDNAVQSGTSDVLGTGGGARQGSAFVTVQSELAFATRLSTRFASQAYYALDGTALLDSAVRRASYQNHELGVRAQVALSTPVTLRIGVAGSYALSGLDQFEPLVSEVSFTSRLELKTSVNSRTRVELGIRPTFGLGDNQSLDGYRADAQVSARLRSGAVEVMARAGSRLVRAGEQRLSVDANAFESCAPECFEYRAQLSYLAPLAGLDFAYELTNRWGLGASLRVEQRRYLEPGSITGHPETEKERRDVRFRARAGAELALDRESTVRLTLDQTLIVNRSNVDHDPNSAEHSNDYANCSFDQNVSELGVMALF